MPSFQESRFFQTLKIDESRLPQDGRFHYDTAIKISLDLRVSTLPNVNGEKIVYAYFRQEHPKYQHLKNWAFRGIALKWTLDNIKQDAWYFFGHWSLLVLENQRHCIPYSRCVIQRQ